MRASDLSSHPSWGSRHASLQPVFYMGFGGIQMFLMLMWQILGRAISLAPFVCVCLGARVCTRTLEARTRTLPPPQITDLCLAAWLQGHQALRILPSPPLSSPCAEVTGTCWYVQIQAQVLMRSKHPFPSTPTLQPASS